jgi:hypothetical protein
VTTFVTEIGRIYRSDSAFTAGVLLAFGLMGIFSSISMHLISR